MVTWKERLFDLIFPRYCCICGEFLSTHNFEYICETCAKKIVFIGENICIKCGHDFGEVLGERPFFCHRCSHSEFQFIALRSAVRLNHITRSLIHQLKYKQGEYLAKDFAKIIQKNATFMALLQDSILVPVPLHWKRVFKREYNQSEIIAKSLQKLPIDMKVLSLLKRRRHTPPQVGLHINERRENVKNAFSIDPKFKIDHERKLIVFDDVFTTGATINECCKILRKHGFHNIYAATFTQVSKN
ncbi:MAG: ComF family protein [Puniceicoccales bacterium]|jgi:ComF family protein|nr:ComF family protein [Puniceicoccales bacterium]